ncbi:methyltransferase domain-containing protein [Staphylococcus aureus]|uniref:methyltransferase domain-containing protein n=1 Tax=Staphylococcus aureus TaxID=1280 RepID=UPI002104D9AC|nr:methyltransferase domain-containing protein [Staphylococcus aureus]MCT6555953.1 methyltransferase domain-containing protein [Staphylococcus aureus]MCT6643837.1 methyltransferase domain-containing protein [Staphylococcus aureus]MCT6677266.1 methyltransferase domain-containing protein [Staphylococcus aureus]MDD9454498.1 methyltransferase domain-containing protein [Staphylococcus aureus]MDD9459703.1 methyltransferase domain-containing protein [Staphylococcus aureus]
MFMQNRNDFIEKLLDRAQIEEGMRVLDIGCATGEVTQLIAKRVGTNGEVVGVDVNESLLKSANENNQYNNVSYQSSDIYQLPETMGHFDAIVGRRVLMYLPDAEKCLQILKSILKPEGILCFQESDAINAGVGADTLSLHQSAIQWIWETVKQEGGNIHIGQNLYNLFNNNGMHVVDYFAEVVIQTSMDNDLAWLVDVMLQRMKAHGVINDDFSLDEFKSNLEQEAINNQCAFIRDMAFGIIGKA